MVRQPSRLLLLARPQPWDFQAAAAPLRLRSSLTPRIGAPLAVPLRTYAGAVHLQSAAPMKHIFTPINALPALPWSQVSEATHTLQKLHLSARSSGYRISRT